MAVVGSKVHENGAKNILKKSAVLLGVTSYFIIFLALITTK
ncbi:hypothetical protein [Aquimarina addita]